MEETSSVQSSGAHARIALRDYIAHQFNISDPGPPDESGLVPCPACKAKLSPQAEMCRACHHPIGPIRRAKARFRFEKFWWFWLTVLMTALLLFLLYRMHLVPTVADPFARYAGRMREIASYAVGIAVPITWINYWWRYGRIQL
ncbi:MAG: hypothetical protein HYV17_07945 [Xanthomonadales bacterium]|nr:hypothetical protein [Xanthomonadales bacterium]